jgi:hypothetical protein
MGSMAGRHERAATATATAKQRATISEIIFETTMA